jgi:hypothetical protein
VPGHELDDAWKKLIWAKQHFEIVEFRVRQFEEFDEHTISCEVDAETGTYVFYVHGIRQTDDDLGLLIGDCLHNARTALDYLMVQLVARVTGTPPRDVERIQFPIYDDTKRFNGAVSEVINEPGFSGYLARIQELQPFNARNASIWGNGPGGRPPNAQLPAALARLAELDNIDKHRVLHAACLVTAYRRSVFLEPPPGFEIVQGPIYKTHPLKDGAEVGHAMFKTPLPQEWEPDQVDMQRAFPIEVALDEPMPRQAVLEMLPFCLRGVEHVLTLFAPVFRDGATALPVTTAPPTESMFDPVH